MSTDKSKFYITTSIPYLNAPPHLGHALEFVQADIIARHRRLRGEDVFFLSGADEHGAKIARAAEAAGKTPKEFIFGQVAFFLDLLKKLNVSNDDFIRTSDKERHWLGAEEMWRRLQKSGDIYKSFYKGLYCVGHEAFVTAKDLNKDGLCEDHKKAPEVIEEENYLFKLTKYKNELKKKIESGEFKILPEWRKAETLNMLEDISDISFSRPSKDLSWGIPVPDDATQTMYVWCDALSNYISALGFGQGQQSVLESNTTPPTPLLTKEGGEGGRLSSPQTEGHFLRFWPADLHIIGKDITKFHTIFWPAMLMSAGLSLPKTIFVHGFIHVKREKMSKSIGNVVDPFPLIEKYGADAARFYLAHEVPTFGDGDYTEEHFKDVYEGSLVNGLGNLLSRTLKMMSSFPEITKPHESLLTKYPLRKNLDFLAAENKKISLEEASPVFLVDHVLWAKYKKEMESYNLGVAFKGVFAYLRRLDEYIEEYKVYKMIPTDPEGAKVILWNLAYSLASAAWMLKPFMPATSDNILNSFGVDPNSSEPWTTFSAKSVIHLFPRIK